MKITPEILKYASGAEFSNSFELNFDRTQYKAMAREDAIVGIIRGLDVVHIGCSDHVPLIREKIKANKWLHKLITENSRSCIGIDNDRESIEFLTKELGFTNVRYGDILAGNIDEIYSGEWDYAVFGEMIEHLDNPVDFLETFRKSYSANVRKFIITVPNIYNRFNLRNMFRYREIVNSDHRFWFTPYTAIKVLVSAGLRPEEISFANLVSLSVPELLLRKARKLLSITPAYPYYFFKSIIITGTF
jgi:hypothetical protein